MGIDVSGYIRLLHPLQLPEFWVVLIFLGVMSVIPRQDDL